MKIKQNIDWADFVTGGGLLYLILAVVCIAGAGLTLYRGSGMDHWPATNGIVTMARVAPGIPGSQQRARYLFAYEYQVEGRSYRSDRYDYSSVGGNRPEGVRRYEEGDQVTVFYNPRHPASATLVKQKPGLAVYLALGLGLVFLVAALGHLLTGNAFALFSRSGLRQWRERHTGSHAGASARRVAIDPDDPKTAVEALPNPLRRECLEYLADTEQIYGSASDSGPFRLENAARHLHETTGIGLNEARTMMRLLADKEGIDLSPAPNDSAS